MLSLFKLLRFTPLHWAAMNGKNECLELLIKARADVDFRSKVRIYPVSIIFYFFFYTT